MLGGLDMALTQKHSYELVEWEGTVFTSASVEIKGLANINHPRPTLSHKDALTFQFGQMGLLGPPCCCRLILKEQNLQKAGSPHPVSPEWQGRRARDPLGSNSSTDTAI